jgi:hypothetical protein
MNRFFQQGRSKPSRLDIFHPKKKVYILSITSLVQCDEEPKPVQLKELPSPAPNLFGKNRAGVI